MTDSDENFESWVTAMPDALESFAGLVPAALGAQLDFTRESLVALESWMLETYRNIDAYKSESNTEVFDGIPRYIGETLRRNLGGHWDIDLKNSKNVYFGLPVLVGAGGDNSPACPHRLATALLARRNGSFLSSLYDSLARGS